VVSDVPVDDEAPVVVTPSGGDFENLQILRTCIHRGDLPVLIGVGFAYVYS
jgi:hypothetical protein